MKWKKASVAFAIIVQAIVVDVKLIQ